MSEEPVVITGMGTVSPLGASLEGTWEALLAGGRGIRPIRRFDPAGLPVRVAAELPPRDRETLTGSEGPRITGLQTALLMASSRAALRQARLEGPAVGREEIGFFAGLGAVDYDVDDLLPAVRGSRSPQGALDYRAFFLEHHRKIHPLWLLSQLNNVAFCQVAIALDIRGENAVLSQHGDAGAQAIAEGFHAVREGRVRIALVGGTGEEVTPNSLARYLLLGVLSARSGGQCHPFAADRSGAVLGEGGGALVLEHRSSAAARGVPCLAEVGGIGSACELAGPGGAPTPAAIGKAMTIACSEAGVGPEAVDLVIAHGDGTPAGDGNEAVAIEEFFGSALDAIGVLSVKGALGHLLAGAPLLDAALGARMLRHGVCPGMATDLAPDPNFGLPLLTGGPTARPLRRILINARGLAGQCVSLVLAAGARPE